MDDAIGAVTAALRETGQRERTLVFFFSDNGGHRRRAARTTARCAAARARSTKAACACRSS